MLVALVLLAALAVLPTTGVAGHWEGFYIESSVDVSSFSTDASSNTNTLFDHKGNLDVSPYSVRLCPTDKDLATARCEVKEAEQAIKDERQDLKQRSDEAKEDFSRCMREEISSTELEWDGGSSHEAACRSSYLHRTMFLTTHVVQVLEDQLRDAEQRLADLEYEARNCNEDRVE